MWLNQTSAPAETPVSLTEAKAHLRVLHAHDDAYITALIAGATAHLDARHGILGRALVTQSWEYRLHCFPDCEIDLPFPPLVSVGSVKYIHEAGTETTVSADDYVVDTGAYIGAIRPAYDVEWPVARDEANAVRIVFTAGYGAAEAVPMPIKQAMLLMIGHWYAHREAVTDQGMSEVPMAAKYLLAPYRRQSF